ncbi:hypothetical protein BJ978_000452 [Agromyces terreus]|uniref:Ribbon-helix-helix protein CopG domain-containing protein n=1 Tax=Agromyces terreus TaxID=424795 RepID=A0A9X2KAZ0_9MICO|nr:ribbon-helix-helix protein, CopG family [Agromyces terreus]MCP2369776.1 hypothetical protein [Agromyces terreus]
MSANSRRRFELPERPTVASVETEDVIYRGEALTDDRVDRIVADVRRANLVPGGKSLNGDGTHAKPLTIRLPDEVREEIDQIAEAEGVSTSKVARRALVEWLQSRRIA